MKISELKEGMKDIDLEVTIDYIPPNHDPQWSAIFVKDETKDIRMILQGENLKKAREGGRIRIKNGYVTKYRGQLQLNSDEVEFLDE